MFNKNIKIDELTHTYYLDVPSVSKLIELHPRYTLNPETYNRVLPYQLEQAKERGNCLHSRIENYIETNIDFGCLCIGNNCLEHNKLFEWLINKLKENKVFNNLQKGLYWTEISLYNGEFTGTFDFAYIDKKDVFHLIDWKTTSKTKWNRVALQLWFYWVLICDKEKDKDNFIFDKYKLEFECYNPRLEKYKLFNIKEINQAAIEYYEIINNYFKK